ncbi:MAG TPA: DUF3037 domain-containing protein [Methylomirabilota bacterium]|nr:DUF3037 domain-containing protein [Methylomirabilota bacterium]
MSTATNYTVVHYLPNPLSGERINVGVIAWNEGRIAARFIDDWRRVHSFGGEDVEFIRDFVERVQEAIGSEPMLPGLAAGSQLDEERLKKIVGTWTHSLQFSEPRASLKAPAAVVDEVAPIFLRGSRRRIKTWRDRRAAAALVASSIRSSVTRLVKAKSYELVKRNHPIKGKLGRHPFDVVVANGKPLFAAQGLSFQIGDTRLLDLETNATAFAITDVRMALPHFPLAVLTLPPAKKSPLFSQAQRVFHGLSAEVVESEDEMTRWAARVAKRLLPTS